ncbi:MAG: 2-oxoglutarate dehydrogenase E1 component, partial [Coxiellaceae bacterium]|nr:2-oxoglutarate dehydrogenase E1 component [Coxiellaceae bacterium]
MSDSKIAQWQLSSYLGGGNEAYIEELYETYLQNPNDVPQEWQTYFASFPMVDGVSRDVSHAQIRQHFLTSARLPKSVAAVGGDIAQEHKLQGVKRLIDAYRRHGHRAATIDPITGKGQHERRLNPEHYGITNDDMSKSFNVGPLMDDTAAPLTDIIARLQQIYTGDIGAEYTYIDDEEERHWLRERFERGYSHKQFSQEQQKDILRQLTAADGLEKYLGHKYIGQKRFSLEGGDSLIPLLNTIIQEGGAAGLKEVSIGMAHRGRLNVLVNVCGQPARELFDEFEGKKEQGLTSGDVKYHLGFSSDVQTPGGPLHISLAFNPSHLEVIAAVVMGSVRARQDRHRDIERDKAMAIVIHGDAAIAGQGIVMETFNMSQTRAYGVGGSIHIVVNNQVGFTTSDPHDARSSLYCTDIAKMIQAPVFHVNSDDPEAVVFLAQLAVEYRRKFDKDIIIDLVCYRRHGHNEADEPRATQPMMYQQIDELKSPRERYAQRLIEQGVCDQDFVEKLFDDYRNGLDQGKIMRDTLTGGTKHELTEAWKPYLNQEWYAPADTGYDLERLKTLGKMLVTFPANFTLQRQVNLVVKHRTAMVNGEDLMDWGCAENLAYASLMDQGYNIRMSGQDVKRGTFAHRHAAYHDQNTGEVIIPLTQLASDKVHFQIYDSLLSEEAVLGFEFGYSKTAHKDLVIWEAQFGDFANGAQVIIDQFISSAWEKWQRLSGLVMLLPHGYEGMGPEHSSARLERFLQLCAQHNMQVCVPTTPAQVFHMLRRQVLRPYR